MEDNSNKIKDKCRVESSNDQKIEDRRDEPSLDKLAQSRDHNRAERRDDISCTSFLRHDWASNIYTSLRDTPLCVICGQILFQSR